MRRAAVDNRVARNIPRPFLRFASTLSSSFHRERLVEAKSVCASALSRQLLQPGAFDRRRALLGDYHRRGVGLSREDHRHISVGSS